MRRSLRRFVLLAAATLMPAGRALALPPGFQDTVVWSNLNTPTAIRFAPDGRVFVAEKRGTIKVFSSLADPTPDVLADLSTNVHDFWDRGLLGLALDPAFPTRPYVYVLYTYDYDPNTPSIPAPRWGDTCPASPGATTDGCVVNGRLSKLQVNASNQLVGGEQVLLQNNWCQQYPSHSMGDLVFDSAGALLASAGEGASFDFVDYGQGGGSAGSPIPKNPCGDPPTGRGGSQTAPTAEGGSLRSQDLRTPADPLAWNGSVLRIHPDTGAAWPDNPLIGGSAGDDLTIAYGLRNPFRMTARPGTGEIWIGEVGWDEFEEIDRIVSPSDATVENFGWPCYEGSPHQTAFEARNLNLCESLYAAGPAAVTAPYFAYQHRVAVTPGGDGCDNGTSALSGIAFYPAGTFPSTYTNALFFADYARGCIYVMTAGAGGAPDPATRTVFSQGPRAVDLRLGPGGDLFYADINANSIRRIHYTSANTPPTAVIQASPTGGPLPLTVQFDGSQSFDPDPGATLTYAWDLDGDGLVDDATSVAPSRTYGSNGPITVRLRVTDNQSAINVATTVIYPGNTPPTATVLSPAPSLKWRVGNAIGFSGSGSDPESGALPASAMHWDVVLHHCPGGQECHTHTVQQLDGVAGGTFIAPDHEWYSFLEFRLRVTDPAGLTGNASVSIDPDVVQLSYDTIPPGLSLVVGAAAGTAPFTRPAIIGSLNTVSAPESQTLGGNSYQWLSWSNGGPRSQEIVAGSAPATYVATYTSEKILVVAPHPGDEARSAAGVIARARTNGISVKTLFVTNGEAGGGTSAGLARQLEAVLADGHLGLVEDDLVFLGYPDGYLSTVFATIPGPAAFTTPAGLSATYGSRGLGRMDYHRYVHGASAGYNRANLVADLASYLDSYRPTHIFAPSPKDRHFDHQAAYAALLEALQVVSASSPSYAPTVHTSIIWSDAPTKPPAWPEPASPTTPFTPPPNLASLGLSWGAAEHLDVPIAMEATPLTLNPKYVTLAEYAGLGGGTGPLGRFLHADEFFWTESPLGSNGPPHVDAGTDQLVSAGALVQLSGSGSSDPEGNPLTFVWRQASGATVALSDPSVAQPTFIAPAGAGQVLAFELLVGDGHVMSVADSVQVRVQAAGNGAPVANAGPDQSVAEGVLVTLNGTASSDPNGNPLTYEWTQTAGPTVTLSDATSSLPTFLGPAGLTQNTTLTFRLVVRDGFLASAPDTVSIVVAWSPNVAAQASVTASSQTSATGQLATKAVDGVVAGYPGDYTKEWATNGQKAGAWIQLVWSRPFQLDRVTLYDRPNVNDRVLAGTLLFSDGSTVAVGSLDNGGVATIVSFTARTTSSLRFTVTSVSATTENVGLAEMEARRTQGQTDVDQDGWSVAEGDCNDASSLAHPGGAEIPYNGIDDDCLPSTSEDDLDHDGIAFASDCNDANPLARTLPPEVAPLVVGRVPGAARLSWPDVRAAAGSETVYDVIDGSIGELRGDAGFARASCFASMSPATTLDDARATAPPGRYYLVRAKSSCGWGTAGSASAVPDPRDALEGPSVCP